MATRGERDAANGGAARDASLFDARDSRSPHFASRSAGTIVWPPSQEAVGGGDPGRRAL